MHSLQIIAKQDFVSENHKNEFWIECCQTLIYLENDFKKCRISRMHFFILEENLENGSQKEL